MFSTAQLLLSACRRVRGAATTRAGLSASGFSTASNSQRLAGKVAVITGAASGIGKATAAEFIRSGAKVIIADVQDDLGHSVAAELGPDAVYTRCDVSDEPQVAAAVDLAVERHGRLDILFNNAGILGAWPQDDMASLDLTKFDRLMSVNTRAMLVGIKHGARVMAPRRSGCIICTASATGVVPVRGMPLYAISKASTIAMVRAMAEPLARDGVRVNAISPGATRTPLMMGTLRMMYPGVSKEELMSMVEHGVDAGATAEPADVARSALFLASDDAKFVTGHNLVADGGFSGYKVYDMAAR